MPNNSDSEEDSVIARSAGFGNGLRGITLTGRVSTADQASYSFRFDTPADCMHLKKRASEAVALMVLFHGSILSKERCQIRLTSLDI